MLADVSPTNSNMLSRFNLAGLTNQAIEGVTVNHLGNRYLVADNAGASPSRLFVLIPVPVRGAV